MSAHAQPAGPSLVDRKLPPVTEVGAASMIAVAGGVIYMAAYLPKHAPIWFALVLLAVAAGLQAANAFLLWRIENFAWGRFFQVWRWSLAAYLLIAGMIEFAFVFDHTRGTALVLLTVLLGLFMLNVPVLIAFTVARYQATD